MADKETHSSMKVTDMTSGSPLRLILIFAVPLFLGNIFQQIYSVVDTMVAGYTLGDRAIAAVGATSSISGLLIGFANGLNSGCAIVVTQCFGAHDTKKLKMSVAGMIVIDASVTAFLTIAAVLFLRPLLHFMNIPDSIFSRAYTYIFVICAGMISTIAYNMFSGILRAFGNSRTSLYFLIISSALNMCMDLVFVVVFDSGIIGLAFATVIAQSVSAFLCGIYVFRNYRRLMPDMTDFRVPAGIYSDLVSSGIAMALMYCVVSLGSVIFRRANNRLGETVISAHTASRRIVEMMMQPLSTIATASSTFIGQNRGADRKDRISIAVRQVLKLEIVFALCECAFIWAFGAYVIRFTTGTDSTRIIENAVMSLRWHLSFFPVLGCLFVLRTGLQAMGRKGIPVMSSCIELLAKIVSAAFIIPKLGFFGTCITEPVTWSLMVIPLVFTFFFNSGF